MMYELIQKTGLYRLVQHGLMILNKLTPKKKNLIFFRAAFAYPDNIQAVLDELIKRNNEGKYQIICAGQGYAPYQHLPNVHMIGNSYLKGLFWYFRSKYVIWDSSIFFNISAISNQISVNLWHGTSLKKIGFYENLQKPYRMSTYAVTYSNLFAPKISYAFGIPLEDVWTTGEPRNDYLFSPASLQDLNKLGIPANTAYKYIIWMPTFRQSKNHNVNNGKKYEYGFPFLNASNLAGLNACAKACNVILILKWHGSQVLPPKDKLAAYSNLVFLTTDQIASYGIAFYKVVAHCDGLITDYSSIYVNYMVLNRPICFAYDDLQEYIQDRGFMFEDVTSIMPGMHAKSIEDVYAFIKNVAAGKDDWRPIRQKIAPQLNKYQDGHNAQRLLDKLDL